MRTRLVFTIPLLAAALAAVPATAGPKPVGTTVAPGYDLFTTVDETKLAVDAAVAGVDVMEFRGVPLRTFDFPGFGTRAVGATDTIVRRYDAATPASPRVRIELVGLLLESTNVPGYFVTLQSARPAGLPSTGTLDFVFDSRGLGGLLRSELMVNYDVRRGAPDGPIVFTGSTGMGFVAEDLLWTRSAPEDDEATQCVAFNSVRQTYCVETERMCHWAGGTINHLHCVGGDIGRLEIRLEGINHKLNGRDTSADFHPVGTASRR